MSTTRPINRLREFLHLEAAGSVVLLAAAVVALIWANGPGASTYVDFWHAILGIDAGGLRLTGSLQHWVNDALMVIFFFVVGLEIKFELVNGDLRDPRTAALPIVAAVGGMVVPAGVYALIAGGGDAAAGWGIPMATDIAFAVGVLGVLGRRVPSALRLFLLTLAIVDDIGAIVVIAIFYTASVELWWLGLAIAMLLLMTGIRSRVRSVSAYVVLGVAVWFALLQSGVHATLAGVAIGLITPASGSILERLQSLLHPVSSYAVLPVFALANAGVALGGIGAALASPVGLGVGVGLVLGKPVGIVLASLIAVRLGLAKLPAGATWPMLAGVGCVAGVGFTVSLFIAGLSFPGSEALGDQAKVAILVGSVIAAMVGALVLVLSSRRRPA